MWDVEMRRFDLLHPSSYSKTQDLFNQHIIKENLHTLFSFCKYMINTKQWEDVSAVYNLVSLIESGLPAFVQIFEDCMKENMLTDTSNKQDFSGSSQFMKTLVKQHMEYYNIIRTTFWNNPKFLDALDRVSTTAVNSATRAAERLAEYSNSLLKKCTTANKATELDKQFEGCVQLSTCLDDGDMYINSCSKYMSKRLLLGTSRSLDIENMMISRLTNVYGTYDTRNLVQMVQDMTVCEKLTEEF